MIDNISDGTRTLLVSYIGVRRAIGLIGMLLPIALVLGGWLAYGIEPQDNISSYYHTPVRDIFVGAMCAISCFLFCYRGYDGIERLTGYCGSGAALGVALFPLDANSDPLFQRSVIGYLHTVSGGIFFLTLAIYALYHFPKHSAEQSDVALVRSRNFVYQTSGVVILISIAAMGCYLFLLSAERKALLNHYNLLLWMECVAVWAFAAAWLTKGHAILAELAVHLIAVPTRWIAEKGEGIER